MPQRSLTRAALSFGAVAILALPAHAQRPFEGVVTARSAAPGGPPQDLTFSIKGDKLRMDAATASPMGPFGMVIDRGARKMITLIGARQMYMERDIPPDAGLVDSVPRGASFQWTGKKETIAGTECEHASVKEQDGTQYDVCIARGLGFFFRAQGGMGRRGGGPAGGWQGTVPNGFPLRVVKAGESTPQFEVTKIERKSLGDDVFAPPAGWQKMEMPGMGRP